MQTSKSKQLKTHMIKKMPQKKHTFEIIKADFTLQGKTGKGPLNPEIVKRCQTVIENNDFDFAPLAKDILAQLKTEITNLETANPNNKAPITKQIRAKVMELKANAGLFKYELVSTLATIMLHFLEEIEKFDQDVMDIISAHQTTISLIIKKEIKGNGGDHGHLLEKELLDACQRYRNSMLSA